MTKRIAIQLDDANETWLVSLRATRESADVEDEEADIVLMHRSEGLGYDQALVQLRTLGCSKEEAEQLLTTSAT